MYSKKLYWTIHTAYWIICEGHNVFIGTYFGVNQNEKYAGLLFEFFILFASTHLFSKFIYARNYTLKDWKVTLIMSLIVCHVLSAIVTYFHIYFYASILTPHLFTTTKIPLSLYLYLYTIRYIYPWFGAFHLLRLYNASFKHQAERDQTAITLKTAELENLKNQLNPHFLFNSLNSIKALTLSDINLSREAITKLFELLRTSLDFKNTAEIYLHQEITLVEQYLALEKIRFENRLNYIIEVSNELATFKIPPMSIQLLVENAIKHGINNSKKGGHISILGYRKGDFLFIQVKNAGKIMTNLRKGIGLDNLNRRLALNYGTNANIHPSRNIRRSHRRDSNPLSNAKIKSV